MHISFALATLLFALTAVAAPVADAESSLEKREPHHSSSSSSGNSGDSGSDEQSILDAHNLYRSWHSAPDLTWNSDLASYAASYASGCVFEHTGGGYGENLAAGYANATAAVGAWYDEIQQYDFSNPGFSEYTGHFTQVVWVESTQVGCAYVSCYTQDTPGMYLMCEYEPAGNVLGYFDANVLSS